MGEDLRVMKEMRLGAAASGRREGKRGREREKLGECINLGYLSVFRTECMIVLVCGTRQARLRRLRTLGLGARNVWTGAWPVSFSIS